MVVNETDPVLALIELIMVGGEGWFLQFISEIQVSPNPTPGKIRSHWSGSSLPLIFLRSTTAWSSAGHLPAVAPTMCYQYALPTCVFITALKTRAALCPGSRRHQPTSSLSRVPRAMFGNICRRPPSGLQSRIEAKGETGTCLGEHGTQTGDCPPFLVT